MSKIYLKRVNVDHLCRGCYFVGKNYCEKPIDLKIKESCYNIIYKQVFPEVTK